MQSQSTIQPSPVIDRYSAIPLHYLTMNDSAGLRITAIRAEFRTAMQNCFNLAKQKHKNISLICFPSYLTGDVTHENMVEQVCIDLREAGITVLLDKWYSTLGQDVTAHVEYIVDKKTTHIIIFGSPAYLQAYNNQGSFQTRLINYLIMSGQDFSKKLIPIILTGTDKESLPSFSCLKIGCNFATRNYFSEIFTLIRDMYNFGSDTHEFNAIVDQFWVTVAAFEEAATSTMEQQYKAKQETEKRLKQQEAHKIVTARFAMLMNGCAPLMTSAPPTSSSTPSSPTTSLPILLESRDDNRLKLVKCVEDIKDKLPTIYDSHLKKALDEDIKLLIKKEQRTFEAITIKITHFLKILNEMDTHQCLTSLEVIVSHLKGMVLRWGQNSSHDLPTWTIKQLLSNLSEIMAPFYPSRSTVISPETVNKESLVLVQQRLLNQKGITDKLKMIGPNAIIKNMKTKTIFISHAWPEEQIPEEQWTQEFALNLLHHFHDAGLNALIDLKQSNCGSHVFQFMRNIPQSDCVIFIVTRTFLKKFLNDGTRGVVVEYLEAINKVRQDNPNRFIIPLCLTEDVNAPALLGAYAGISTHNKDYLTVLKELIITIYGFDQTLNEWWEQNIQPLADADAVATVKSPPLPLTTSTKDIPSVSLLTTPFNQFKPAPTQSQLLGSASSPGLRSADIDSLHQASSIKNDEKSDYPTIAKNSLTKN